MSYSVYLVKNRAGFFLDFEHPTCKGKSNKQPFAHTFALTGRRALYPGTQGVALGWELAALSGRSRRGLRGIAPEKGAYSRVGACPYLLGPIYEPRPCKGLISRILLRGKPRQRYAPLTGRVFKIQKKSRTVLSPIASSEACAHDKRTKREKERPERAASS